MPTSSVSPPSWGFQHIWSQSTPKCKNAADQECSDAVVNWNYPIDEIEDECAKDVFFPIHSYGFLANMDITVTIKYDHVIIVNIVITLGVKLGRNCPHNSLRHRV